MLEQFKQWLRSRVSGKGNAAAAGAACSGEPGLGVRWLGPRQNPFGMEILDCRPFALGMVSVTQDPNIASRFLQLRSSFREELRGVAPEGARSIPSTLAYPFQGEVQDGAVFKAETMEDKWDIYLYDGHLYFARSWTGELIFRARVEFQPGLARVTAIETVRPNEDSFVLQQVDYLIKSHLFKREVPHPLPKDFGRDAQQLALYSFSEYGRRGLYGTLSNTVAVGPLLPFQGKNRY